MQIKLYICNFYLPYIYNFKFTVSFFFLKICKISSYASLRKFCFIFDEWVIALCGWMARLLIELRYRRCRFWCHCGCCFSLKSSVISVPYYSVLELCITAIIFNANSIVLVLSLVLAACLNFSCSTARITVIELKGCVLL